MEWFQTESGYDYGYIRISTDGGNTWSTLSSRDGSSGWRQYQVDVTQYANRQVRLGFQFTSDVAITYLGWYIDNVQIVRNDPEPLSGTLTSLNSQNFPFIYMNVAVDTFGVGLPSLTASSFQVFENNTLQSNYFEVIPPTVGGGVRWADIVFVLDVSTSMGGEISAVRTNMIRFINAVFGSGIDYRVGFVVYANDNYVYNGGNLYSSQAEITTVVNNITLDEHGVGVGNTKIPEDGFDALQAASLMNFRAGAQRIVIMITDAPSHYANDHIDYPSQYEGILTSLTLQATVSMLRSHSMTCFVIGPIFDTEVGLGMTYGQFISLYPNFGGQYDGPGSLTNETRGRFYAVTSDFSSIVQDIAATVGNTYVVRYRTSNPVPDGAARSVQVQVTYGSHSDTATGSYIPGSAPAIERTAATLSLHNQAWIEGTTFNIDAGITDNIAPFVQSAHLYYRKTGTASYSSVTMSLQSGNVYRGVVPGSVVRTPGLDYYITATDGMSTSSDPTTDPSTLPYQLAILPNMAPAITHTPLTSALPGQAITVRATILDNTNTLALAKLHYRQTGQLSFIEASMISTGGNEYEGTIPGAFVTANGVDYYISAADNFGVTSYSGTRDVPHHIIVSQPWPSVQGPAIVLKVIVRSLSAVRRVVLSDGTFVVTADLSSNGFASFSSNVLQLFGQQGRSISKIELFGVDGGLLGHLKLPYTVSDYSASKKFDAILFLYNSAEFQPPAIQGWDYYLQGEYPVTMLIPPKENVSFINTSQKPLLLVHGVTGSYPYWGSLPSDQQLRDGFDVWQFYYPYDGPIEDNGKFLSQAIAELLTPSRLVGSNSNYSQGRVNLVAHSMGGLVTRSYIQSFDYRNNINKLLMLGTPNHGSFIAYRIHYGHLADEISFWKERDDQAPAWKEMTPGSDFLFELDVNPPRNLYTRSDSSYLVVAGTTDEVPLIHEEISDQDDGVVSVSSASLLKFDIPIGTIRSTHSGLTGDSKSVIMEFMKDDYDPNNPPMNVFNGFWRNANDSRHLDNSIDLHKGILELKMPGITNQANFQISQNGNELTLCQNGSGAQYLRRIRGRELLSPPNYFSLNPRGVLLDEIGLGFPEKSGTNLYDLRFQKHSFFGGCQTFSRLANRLPFRHIQTVMHSIQFSSPELTILNSTDYIFPTPIPAKSMILATAEVSVDSTIDSLVFLLSGYEGDVQFPSHDFKLQAPSGTQIDSVFAKNDPNMDFRQDIIGGYAYYFVRHPQPGSWKTLYNSNLSKGSLSAYINSPFSFDILLLDSAISINSKVNFDVRLPQPRGYAISTISTSLLFSGTDGATPRQISTIHLIISPDSSKYSGTFNTRDPGTYYVALDAKVTAQGNTIERHTFRSITIEYGTTPPTGGQLSNGRVYSYPNPFNPDIEVGTLRYSLSQASDVTIRIYDVSNRVVRTIHQGNQPASTELYTSWDGKNETNATVANGVYFYVIESSSGERAVGKVAVLR
jgi:pimeloyl-ACP methyl ester carboxylesterase